MSAGEPLATSTVRRKFTASPSAMTMIGDTAYRTAAVLVVLLIVCALLLTTRRWMNWDGDEAQYAMNARAIALGEPYGQTPYIHNALNPIHPAAPPPGLPLMLAPLYAMWGLDWLVFKTACVATFGMFLFLLALIARQWLPPLLALAAVALVGMHPYTWWLKEFFPPELPFMLFAYSALWFAERGAIDAERRILLAYMLASAVCAAAAYLLRPIGIILFPAIALATLWRTRSLLNVGMLATIAGFALAWGVQQRYHPDFGTYLGYLDSLGLHSILANVQAYRVGFRRFLENLAYAGGGTEMLLMILVGSAIVAGFAIRARRQMSAFEWFTLGYCAFLLLYPVHLEPDRYSCPLWPLLLLYALVGCDALGRRLGGRWLRHAPSSLLVGLLIVNFVIEHHRLEASARDVATRVAYADSMYGYIKQSLPANAVVIARQPTVVALVTNRHSSIWPADFSDRQLVDYMGSIGAQYILQDGVDELDPFISRNRDALRLLRAQGPFKLYRLGS